MQPGEKNASGSRDEKSGDEGKWQKERRVIAGLSKGLGNREKTQMANAWGLE